MATYYENLKGMLRDAEEILAMAKAQGNADKAALWAVKVALHKAELAKYA